MTSRTKIGVLVVALAAAIGLPGLMGVSNQDASAHTTNLVLGSTTVVLGGSTTLTVSFIDDEVHSFTISASPFAFFALFIAAGGDLAACTTGLGTSTVVVTEAICDPDTIVEASVGTPTVGCVVAGIVTITSSSPTLGTTNSVTLTCGLGPIQIGPGSTCPVADDLNDVRVCKVNQLGAPLSATFALVGPSGTIELVTNSSTAPTPTQDGPPPGLDPAVPDAGPGTCATSQTCASVLTAGLGDGSPGALGIADLTPGTYSLQEITAPAGSIQIQIMNGLGQIIPPGVPISVTIPCASLAVCTFLFTNSQPLAATATPSGTATATPTPIVTATPITPVPFLLFVQPPPRLGGIGAILTGPTGLPTPAPAAAVALVPAARAIVPPSTGDAGLASECTD